MVTWIVAIVDLSNVDSIESCRECVSLFLLCDGKLALSSIDRRESHQNAKFEPVKVGGELLLC